MNSWLLASIIILGIAVVLLVGCIVAVLGPIKKVVTLLLARVEGIQKQLSYIQTETVKLTETMDRIKTDIEFKKDSVQSVIQSVKNTGIVLNQVSDVSYDKTSAVLKKANNDSQRQAEVKEWTNIVMSYVNRKAQ
ncbi:MULTISPECIES: DUF948 domain-containing protein [Solibacillus]|uniref:DUF948 domain-containing protein n=1 Tax=Solibacillus merdavium TaxID=2762218 RepID=A0ABR8XP50_9BACL|nr:DUF948 domain-containing protein [Solibacillus merdavium]MBD8033710.1 DUF948 domain-containing protein [Solibacillus merdavium]